MSIECFELVEHFDYIKNYVPQPFYISSDSVKEFMINDDGYFIVANNRKYSLNRQTAKKLVDSLGIKIKLFTDNGNSESNVVEQVLPAINKLFKCFADCFVFYASNEDPLEIIDLNVNNMKGSEGTKYENGPSPWKFDLKHNASVFTCFNNFLTTYCINKDDQVMVKADDIMSSPVNVSMYLFKVVHDTTLQPMLSFNSKFSNMNGFADIHPVLYDSSTDIYITFPMNYVKSLDQDIFDDMWNKKLTHLSQTTDLNDYIFREVNELAASNEAPTSVKNFISALLVDSTLNLNQPIGTILTEAHNLSTQMKPAKAKKFKKQLGVVLGYCLCQRHMSCAKCGHMDLID